MRKLLNTLYILTETAYLALDGEAVNVLFDDNSHRLIPLHTIESIVCFSYKGASPALMGKCREKNISITFFSPSGKYLATVSNGMNGNVLLRRTQFRYADDIEKSLSISKNFITGKLYNSKYVLLRYARDHKMQLDCNRIKKAADNISCYMKDLQSAESEDTVRGIEGNAAAEYFGVFDELILSNKKDFYFNGRNRRPPMDNVNALLSLSYTMLSRECAAALYSVGLDPYVGFMHSDRPGRQSLALDLMEELRSVYADKFILSLINNRIFNSKDFEKQASGAVNMTDKSRKKFFSEWQKKKKEELKHPYIDEKISWGLVPYVQSMLLARYLRGDLDEYPPFFWK